LRAIALPEKDAELDTAKEPAAQVVQTRSATDEAGTAKKVPGGHVLLCAEGQALATVSCGVEEATVLAKVPWPQFVHERSAVALAAAE